MNTRILKARPKKVSSPAKPEASAAAPVAPPPKATVSSWGATCVRPIRRVIE